MKDEPLLDVFWLCRKSAVGTGRRKTKRRLGATSSRTVSARKS